MPTKPDTTVKHFLSTVPNAPSLSATPGSLVAVLDACLVHGWGLLPATSLSVTDGIATVQFAAPHSFTPHTVALVDGITAGTYAGLNGEQKVVDCPTSNTLRFLAPDLPDGTAEGAVTLKLAPAGWEIVFESGHKRVYRSTAVESLGDHLWVDDSGTLSARVCGYRDMTDIDTGTDAFPTAEMIAGGGYWWKAQNTTGARSWAVCAGEQFFMYAPQPHSNGASEGVVYGFGDFLPYWSADAGSTLLVSSSAQITNAPGDRTLTACQPDTSVNFIAASNAAGAGGAIRVGTMSFGISPSTTSGSGQSSNQLPTYPLPFSGGVLLSAVTVFAGGAPRGVVPGLRHTPQSVSRVWPDKSLLPETSDGRQWLVLTGRSFNSSNAIYNSVVFVDVTGPWR